jgi:hypothetical protein
MRQPRVRRSTGPKSNMTEATYRKKALPFLLKDFERRCAYCLDPDDFRHPSQNHVDYFNCRLRPRNRNKYQNLMLACVTCNTCKHDKPVVNPLQKEQRLLNCTEENEFPRHIVEEADGRWKPVTPAGQYHIVSICLDERCHTQKRAWRRRITHQILELCTTAIQYQSHNPLKTHDTLIQTIRQMLALLDNFPPLITDKGVLTARDWLRQEGVCLDFVAPVSSPPQQPSPEA